MSKIVMTGRACSLFSVLLCVIFADRDASSFQPEVTAGCPSRLRDLVATTT
jgi:hypothetical protein